jgi:hypothetical protein
MITIFGSQKGVFKQQKAQSFDVLWKKSHFCQFSLFALEMITFTPAHLKNWQKMGNVFDSTAHPNSSADPMASAGNSSKISARLGIPGTSGFLEPMQQS